MQIVEALQKHHQCSDQNGRASKARCAFDHGRVFVSDHRESNGLTANAGRAPGDKHKQGATKSEPKPQHTGVSK